MSIRGGPWDGSKSQRRRYCHVEANAWDFEMAQLQIGSKSTITCQNSEMAHFFRPETLRWLKIRTETEFEILIASNFELSQSFRYEKVSHLGVLTRDRDFEPIWRWAISKSNAYASTTTPPSMTFLVISRTPAYSIFVCLGKKTYYETACDSNVENETIRFKFYGRLIMKFKEISRWWRGTS